DRLATDVDDGARSMANPHRDADAALVHARCLPAAGKLARMGGRERSLSPRLGLRYCARVPLTVNSLGGRWRGLGCRNQARSVSLLLRTPGSPARRRGGE